MCEAPASSDYSGAESDSFNRYHGARGIDRRPNGGRYPQNRPNVYPNSSNRQGCFKQTNVDWDRIRVEDFIDEDFDFEGNLALFDKSAFYEMVNLREGNTNQVPDHGVGGGQSSEAPNHLYEGPDGVGVPLICEFALLISLFFSPLS